MEQPLISLCMIVGNVEEYIERCLESFRNVADEICLVRAIGNQKPDKTIEIAQRYCSSASVPLAYSEYKNAPDHAEWPHLDNFAAARNESFKLATGKYLFWADSDDVFGDGNAENTKIMAEEVRAQAREGKWPVYVYTYNIFGRGLEIHRERMVLRGLCGWKYPVHECMDTPEGTQALQDDRIIITHLPHSTKEGSNPRNLRILESIPEDQMDPGLWYHLHGEYVYQKNEMKAVWAAKKALDFNVTENCRASVSDADPSSLNGVSQKRPTNPGLGRPERYEIFMNLGKMATQDPARPQLGLAEDYFLQAFKADPRRREALGLLTCNRIDAGKYDHALGYAQAMMGIERPKQESWNDRGSAYEWLGVDIYTQALRVNGRDKEANNYRLDVLAHARKTRPIISLIHATRGRPRQASIARKLWCELAERPDAIEHIFVIDEDDKESYCLQRLHTLMVKPGGGCVMAWNMGAFNAQGDILIQMSDDWVPPARWDTLIIERFVEDFRKRPTPNAERPIPNSENGREALDHSTLDVGRSALGVSEALSQPRVLAVSDGHRKDDLLCMAIMTMPYFRRDFFMFHPWFTGVYSDNYFTSMAYERKAVIDARDLVFNHDHPFFRTAGHPERSEGPHKQPQLDATYAAQNSKESYELGKATYDQLLQRKDWSTVPGYCNYWGFYQNVAKTLKDGDVVAEIGVWMGRSIILLAQECKRLGKNKVKFYAVDNFKGESNQREHEDTIALLKNKYCRAFESPAVASHPLRVSDAAPLRREFESNIARCEVADMIEILDGESHRVANVVSSESLAFCFIDAAHDEESVKRDIDAWLPKVKKDHVIAGHDAQHPPVLAALKSRLGEGKFDVLGPVWIAKKI